MLKTSFYVVVGVLTLVCGFAWPLPEDVTAITAADSAALRGGGDDIACIGTYPCTACVPPAGCAVWGMFGYVACTSNGSDGFFPRC